jgi:hypothetical protein
VKGRSLNCIASNCHVIVPLDSNPEFDWLADIAEIRIDLANPDQCGKLKLSTTKLLRGGD